MYGPLLRWKLIFQPLTNGFVNAFKTLLKAAFGFEGNVNLCYFKNLETVFKS